MENSNSREVDVEDPYYAQIKAQVFKMKGYLSLDRKKDISFFDLQDALSGHAHIYTDLLELQSYARREFKEAQEEFDEWFSEKFLFVRAEKNKLELSAQKWMSQKELEYEVRFTYKDEYRAKKRYLLDVEGKYEFIKDMVDLWKGYHYTLSNLSSNSQSEARVGLSKNSY